MQHSDKKQKIKDPVTTFSGAQGHRGGIKRSYLGHPLTQTQTHALTQWLQGLMFQLWPEWHFPDSQKPFT